MTSVDFRSPMPDFRAAYRDARKRVSAIAIDLDDEALAKMVPACPLWSVKDLLAHLVFIASESTVDGGGPVRFASDAPDDILRVLASEQRELIDAWTQGGVDARSDHSVEELFEEWRAHSELLDAQLAGERPWPEGLVAWSTRTRASATSPRTTRTLGALSVLGLIPSPTRRSSPTRAESSSSMAGPRPPECLRSQS